MAKMTPPIKARGIYTVRAPWTVSSTVIYECAAIRSFDDLYKDGIDPYLTIYAPKGATNGAIIDGGAFSFDTEKAKLPNVITLIGNDGSTIHVPDTFITSYPQMGNVVYSRIVLALELPPLPDTADLTSLKTSISNLVAQSYGVVPTIVEKHTPVANNPTSTEHITMEAARIGAITILDTDLAKLLKEQAKSALLEAQIAKLTAILQQHGWLPT